ncbi:helix-turn-helix domain-containing protein [Massilia sp. Dwa41.01b]|uniref:MerR family transcriptional regulator n=1 Tax=Massilia sp. Dwa41.01b TaxID=2709302 RepID=UPI001E43DEA6|nr:helix-turn-helix domain-containing protein [Massilia sp. Dwa41.01b]
MRKTDDDKQDLAYNAAEFCSTKDAARLLGVSHRTVQLWVENGALQAWKTAGGHRRITIASVNRLVEARRQATVAPPVGPARGRASCCWSTTTAPCCASTSSRSPAGACR